MNKFIGIGRLTSDPEIRQTQTGIAVCSFAIAINNGKDKDGNERPSDFITCRAWRQTAEFISRYFTKGKMIAIEGKFKTDKYQHKTHPDITVYNSYILVDNVEFCGDKGSTQPAQTQQQPQYSQHNALEAAEPQMNYGNLSDFEEILSDGDVPF